ncbi:DNA primase [Streptomyces sp. A7024]|uniref:DNA primase n=1 Tax=Streptomyces coryli TaxID=1128680 RepID=A0A6G4U1G9_9ACTN|nr:DNA primase [Streptomyces coryli]NGN66109.1 DNA primase [Streptomyces coryli]
MNNRIGLGLAVAAGYLLGRTKKAKLAIGVAGVVMGKKLPLNPQQLAGVAREQLKNNPQFKEIGSQLSQDLRGVGKAATGAMVNRQISGLADRLHERTTAVQDQVAGVVPGKDDESDRGPEDNETEGEERSERPERQQADRKTSSTARKATGTAKKATSAAKPASKKSGGKAPAKKAPAKKPAARKRSASETKGGGGRG